MTTEANPKTQQRPAAQPAIPPLSDRDRLEAEILALIDGSASRPPVSIMLRNPVTIAAKQFNAAELNSSQQRGVSYVFDYELRICWIRWDNGAGSVGLGWTPFENLLVCNYGLVKAEKPEAKA